MSRIIVACIGLGILFLSIQFPVRTEPREQVVVIQSTAPYYPPVATAPAFQGSIVVETTIGPDGLVRAVNFSDSKSTTKIPIMISTAIECAKRWTFNPIKDQKKLRTVNLSFVYRIMPRDTHVDDMTPIFRPPYEVEIREKELTFKINGNP